MSGSRTRALALLLPTAAVLGAAVLSAQTPSRTPSALAAPAAFDAIADRRLRSLALFGEMGRVIEHPRCLNCHPADDRPTQTDAMRPHRPGVAGGEGGVGAPGLHCATCHGAANFDSANVPGNPKWALAPHSMAWQHRSLAEICRQITDPRRNGGRDLSALVDHMAHDELVGWAWHPGGNRTPAPGTQTAFGALVAAWVRTGAACPAAR